MPPAAFPLPPALRFGPPLPIPTQDQGASSISCSTHINASPLKCLEAVLNTAEYPRWNTFCLKVTVQEASSSSIPTYQGHREITEMIQRPGYLYSGANVDFEVIMEQGKPTNVTRLQVTLLEEFENDGKAGLRVAWKLRGSPWFLLRAERVQEFIEADGGSSTEYYCWETFGGILGYAMPYLVGSKLQDGFGRWMESLKAWVEA